MAPRCNCSLRISRFRQQERHNDPTSDAVIRTIYYFDDFYNIAVEPGISWLDGDGLSDEFVGKITIAGQAQMSKGFDVRPVLRAFATYGFWSKGLQGTIGGPAYTEDQHGLNIGLQTELVTALQAPSPSQLLTKSGGGGESESGGGRLGCRWR